MALKWERCDNGNVPRDAVFGGWDAINGEALFVGRAVHEGNCIVGKVHRYHQCCFVPYGGKEHRYSTYEVLVNPGNSVHLEWVQERDGNVPPNAVRGGSDGGEEYFIGRHSHRGDTLPGKVHRSHGCLYVSYDGNEICKKEYGVLVEE